MLIANERMWLWQVLANTISSAFTDNDTCISYCIHASSSIVIRWCCTHYPRPYIPYLYWRICAMISLANTNGISCDNWCDGTTFLWLVEKSWVCRGPQGFKIIKYITYTIISIGLCKRDVTPVRQQWSYVFLALAHRYIVSFIRQCYLEWCRLVYHPTLEYILHNKTLFWKIHQHKNHTIKS